MTQYKGILLDLDNTLYPYDKAHRNGIEIALGRLSEITRIEKDMLKEKYNLARNQIHIIHYGTASSHNRILYFQKLLELIDKKIVKHTMEIYSIYWDVFLDNMIPFDGVYEFLTLLNHRNIKICLLTDLTAHIQHRKINKLDLFEYIDYIVTSEESGKEKPHPFIFYMGLKKMELLACEAAMIGDNYQKDIIGALNIGIKPYWLYTTNSKITIDKNVISFKTFNELSGYFK